MLARFQDAGVEFTPSTWAVAYADHVARCSGGDSNHAAHEWAAHGLSDICHDVKSAPGVGVQILTDPSVLVSLPKGSDGRPADVGLFGYGGIRGNTVAVDTTNAPILGVSSSDPATALRAAERHKIQKYDEGVRNAAGMLRFVPFAVSEFGSLAPHAEAFLVDSLSPALFQKLTLGGHFGSLILEFTHTSKPIAAPQTFLKVSLLMCIVGDIELRGSSGDDSPTGAVDMQCGAMHLEYF
eukprot:jgi/Tetstr1/462061/TSEL_007131.t1